jgi:hypothetical protein
MGTEGEANIRIQTKIMKEAGHLREFGFGGF